jgi:Rad3-related DNA helicase
MIKDAHIVFLPYNYLTHREYRIMLEKYIGNSIIIFDEAHNVSGASEEGFSINYQGNELGKTKEDFMKL